MATSNANNNGRPSLLPEIGPDGLPRESSVISYTEKIIEEEQLQLRKYIEENYSKIRDVEKELTNLNLEMKLTAGPKKAALEHMRKKIEMSTEKIRLAKLKEEQARKVFVLSIPGVIMFSVSDFKEIFSNHVGRPDIVCLFHLRELRKVLISFQAWEEASKAVKDEEATKQKLCEDLNHLVQESSNAQFARLEELKRRLEALNPSRSSTSVPYDGNPVVPAQTATTPVAAASVPGALETSGGSPGNLLSNQGNVAVGNGHNQQPHVDGEGRKKKNTIQGRGKGIGAIPKGRGSPGPGWTGAGFDVDGRT